MTASTSPLYTKPIRIKNESVLVLGDLQIPYHDERWVNKCKHLALTWGIKSMLLAGDVVDWHALSIFISPDKDPEDELEQNIKHVAELINGFKKIYWFAGNHEDRLARRFGMWTSMAWVKRLVSDSKDIEVSSYYWATVGNDWQIEHPKNTSVVPASHLQRMEMKFHRNIAGFHNHVIGMQQSVDGRSVVLDVGMCAKVDKLDYVSLIHNNRYQMTQGALILRWDKGEYFYHHLTPHTDFDFLERAR